MSDKIPCSLCISSQVYLCYEEKKREYYQCENCELIFVPEKYFLSQKDEKARYDLHNNTQDNKGYVNFLSRLVFHISEVVDPGSRGLDFGSGPEPVLAKMFIEEGYSVSTYDVYYSTDRSVLKRKYDFITAAEVIEHLQEPGKEIKMLWDCLDTGGWLGISTKFLPEKKRDFIDWSYKNDLTHICFFSRTSLKWIATELGAELSFPGRDTALMHKRK